MKCKQSLLKSVKLKSQMERMHLLIKMLGLEGYAF